MRGLPPTDAAPAASAAPLEASMRPERPEPGLARGVWEAPRWAFFAVAAAVLVLSAFYAARRAGLLRRRGPHAISNASLADQFRSRPTKNNP